MAHQAKIITLSVVSIVLIVLGSVALSLIPNVISYFVHKKMALLPHNPSYPLWRDLNIPIYEKFYFFNVTNAKDVLKSGAKPALQEVGPFVFKTKLTKDIQNRTDDQTRLFFRENRQYFFVRNMSSSDLNVTITTLNVPLAVAWQTIQFDKLNKFLAFMIKSFLRTQSYFVDATIDELIFKGTSNKISCLGHLIDPKSQPDCLFAYFRGQNDTDDGLYEINTGVEEPKLVNSIISLNGSASLDIWQGEQCNRISPSTNGELFPTYDVLPADKSLQMFRSDFCRVFNLTLSETMIPSDLMESLLINRYRLDPNIFANETVNKNNSCFKPKKSFSFAGLESLDMKRLMELLKENDSTFEMVEDAFFTAKPEDDDNNYNDNKTVESFVVDYQERPSGVFDLSACKKGIPVFLSFPHFLNADEYYKSQTTGMSANATLHESYIDVEPTTGTPVDFLARIQVNIDTKVDKHQSGSMLNSLMFPALWQEFSIHITEEMANTIIFQTRTPRIIGWSVSSLILAVGVASLFYSILLIIIEFHHRRNNKDEEPLLDEDNATDISGIDNANNNNVMG